MKKERTPLLIHIIFVLFSIACIVPMLLVIAASLTSTTELAQYGFRLIPSEIDLTAYAYLFKNPKMIINGYIVTFFITIIGTFLSVFIMSLTAYALSRQRFLLKRIITWYIYIPTLFGGGLTASYIVNTQFLHLTDSIWIMILPGLVNVFHIFMIRTFFKQLPEGLFDAAMIDGAGEWKIYFSIALSLSKPVLATVAFLGALGRWNEWYRAMLYIRTQEKYPLQYLLQRMMRNVEELQKAMETAPSIVMFQEIPGENLRMALLVVCIGPMMVFFPFFQKYFVKGMTVGAVKG